MKPRTRWNDARDAQLRALYVDRGWTPAACAREMGLDVLAVRRRASRLRLSAARDAALLAEQRLGALQAAERGRRAARRARGQVDWSDAARSLLSRLYVDDDVPAAMIARRLGLAVMTVRRRIARDGLAGARRAAGKPRLRSRNLSEIPNLTFLARDLPRQEAR